MVGCAVRLRSENVLLRAFVVFEGEEDDRDRVFTDRGVFLERCGDA